jgi:hypothetical protein
MWFWKQDPCFQFCLAEAVTSKCQFVLVPPLPHWTSWTPSLHFQVMAPSLPGSPWLLPLAKRVILFSIICPTPLCPLWPCQVSFRNALHPVSFHLARCGSQETFFALVSHIHYYHLSFPGRAWWQGLTFFKALTLPSPLLRALALWLLFTTHFLSFKSVLKVQFLRKSILERIA